jgi:hypothetical protein
MSRTKRVSLLLAAVTALVAQVAPVQGAIGVYVDGRPVSFDVPPTSIQGRLLVPLRGILEQLGATVDYDPRTMHILAVRGAQTVELTVGSRQARVNNEPRLLDVPAYLINGRTLVPLRFISESMGATVQWNEAAQTVLIASPGTALQPPVSAPPASAGQISGRLMAVSTGQNPLVVVRSSDGQDHTIAVTPQTAIFRYNADNNTGGSAPLGVLRAGDQATVDVDGANQAVRIVASYHVVAAGRVATVNPSNRSVTLANGQSYVVRSDALITLNAQGADFSAIQAGRIAKFSVISGTNQAYEVRVTTPPAAAAPPASVIAPTITAPSNGATLGTTFTVSGTSSPGALIRISAQPRLLGEAAQTQTVADPNGRWAANMSVLSIPLVSFPYVVSVVQVVNGVQSDPVSIEVTVH